MFRTTLKSLLSRKLRLTLAGLAVILGVMFVSGSFVLTDTLRGSFDSMFANAYSSLDNSVQPTADTALEDSGQATPTMPASAVEQIQAVPGVAEATGQIYVDGARLIGSNGKVVTTMGAPRYGTNWRGENDFVQLREGRGPEADNEIAINAGLAEAAGVEVGDEVGVLTLQPKKTFTVVGIFGYAGGKDTMSSAHEISFTTDVASELMLGEPGLFTSVSVTATSGTSQVELKDSLQSALGSGYTVETQEELTQSSEDEFTAGLGFFNKILLGFAAVALFVGTFLIINTFSIIIAQRTKELALMRAMGASRRQIIGSVLIEALLIGFIASILGLISGIGVGALLGWVFGKMTEITTAGIQVPTTAIVSAFAVGIPITLLAAVLPAIRAARIPPIAAMQEAAAVDRPLTKLTVSGSLITAAGVTMLTLGLREGSSLTLIGGGVLASFLGVALLTPLLARPIAGLIGQLFSWSTPGRLGRLNSRRNPRRTAITAAALMIGVALIAGMSVIVSSFKSTITSIAGQDIHVDLMISSDWSGSGPQPTFDASVLDKTAQIDGVTKVIGEYDDMASVAVGDKDAEVKYVAAVTSVPDLKSMWSLKTVSGSLPELEADQALIDKTNAEAQGITVGSTATIQFTNGEPQTVTVVGIYDSDLFAGWVLPESMSVLFTSDQPAWSYIELSDSASESDVRDEINALLADSPETTVTSMDDLVDQASESMDQVLMMVQILLGLAILIAILGIINTLALSIIERTRELGMLRAIGLKRAQMMRMVTVESVIISVFGALLGLVVGSGLGIAIVKALKSEGITELTLPWGEFGIYLVLAAIVGVIAAVIPAIRAARVNVLTAIASE